MFVFLYAEINILCVLFLLLILSKACTRVSSPKSRYLFILVLVSNCIFFLLDLAWVAVDGAKFPSAVTVNTFVNMLYFIFSALVSFVWFLYSETKQESLLVNSKKHLIICSIPMVALVVLSFISLKNGCLFYISADNRYHRGSLFVLQLVLSYGYLLFTATKAFILSLKTENYAQKQQFRTIATFVVPTVIAGLIQWLVPQSSVVCVGTTVGILIVFLNMQEQLISVDQMTGLNNRDSMMKYLSERIAQYTGETELFLLMMDVDHFKSINDSYGHLEGDRALIIVANALKMLNDRADYFVARYGGDEFIIICELLKCDDIGAFCNEIKAALSAQCTSIPYELTLSIGYAKYNRNIRTCSDFISIADSELYRAKASART